MESVMTGSILRSASPFKSDHKNKTDGLLLLADICDECIPTAFFDPQYRGVLDKLKYGNEGKNRGQARCRLAQMTDAVILMFIKEINRVLRPSGHLFLWVDKFHLSEGVQPWLADADLQIVDLITWDKMRFGMGYRSRRQADYLLVLQKKPIRAKGCWRLHNIPDVWQERTPKTHAHSKPVELQKQLILATTNEGEYVLDPASGGYSVLEACKRTERRFIGGDIAYGEN